MIVQLTRNSIKTRGLESFVHFSFVGGTILSLKMKVKRAQEEVVLNVYKLKSEVGFYSEMLDMLCLT